MDLPDPYKEAQRFIDNLIQKTNIQFREDHRSYRVSCAYLSCKIFGLTLREVENFIRIFEQILGSTDQLAGWLYQDCYSFFICLLLKDKEVFNKILNGEFTVKTFIQFMKNSKFDFKPGNWEYDSLLSNIAYSLMVDKKSEVDKNLIQQTFPNLSSLPEDKSREIFNSPNGSFGAKYISEAQPALDICEKINQCKSAFN